MVLFRSLTPDRNFKISNGAPSLPIRVWRKRIGPFELSFTAKATISINGLRIIRASAAAPQSKIRFAGEFDQ